MNPLLKLLGLISIGIVLAILITKLQLYLKQRGKKKRLHISEELRRKIFKKYKNACAVCPSRLCLEIHHRNNNPSDNDERNLILLCHHCHIKTKMRV